MPEKAYPETNSFCMTMGVEIIPTKITIVARSPPMQLRSGEYSASATLPGFAPTDFGNFVSLCARLWAIDLKAEEVLL